MKLCFHKLLQELSVIVVVSGASCGQKGDEGETK